MDKDWKKVAEKLPVEPRSDLVNDVLSDIYDNGDALGTPMLLFHREPFTLAEPLDEIMCPEAWERRRRTAKHRWGAWCTCTNCGEDFEAGYSDGGIVLETGPDDATRAGYAEPGPVSNVYLEGETVLCPKCWAAVEVTRRADLRRGRTYQVLQAEVVNVETYTAVMYWLVSRRFDNTGGDHILFLSHAALLVDGDGRLRRFRAKRTGNDVRDVVWLPCSSTRDPMQMPYYSWEAAHHRKIGGWTLAYVPDLDRHTGEKTALKEYIVAGGCWPGAYLHVWEQHPQVENLMRQGLSEAVVSTMDDTLDLAATVHDLCDAPSIPWVDWREVKPHRMLHMSKPAFREISRNHWGAEDVECWDRYRRQLPSADAMDFEYCRKRIGSKAVGQLLEMVAAGWEDLLPLPVVRYLEKREAVKDGVQMLIDYRKMLRDAEMAETEETRWPRDLLAAHERITKFWANHFKASYQLGFTSTFIRFRELEWTDGDLCIVLPRVEEDLVSEGKVLRHCVGTYGSAHCSGKPVFFVRHRRRPERSYYTLQINMNGTIPKEIQLHGYGNERHGDHKQYAHKIPRKVREFCDRWEREVLTPWFAAQRTGAERPAKKKQKAGRIA